MVRSTLSRAVANAPFGRVGSYCPRFRAIRPRRPPAPFRRVPSPCACKKKARFCICRHAKPRFLVYNTPITYCNQNTPSGVQSQVKSEIPTPFGLIQNAQLAQNAPTFEDQIKADHEIKSCRRFVRSRIWKFSDNADRRRLDEYVERFAAKGAIVCDRLPRPDGLKTLPSSYCVPVEICENKLIDAPRKKRQKDTPHWKKILQEEFARGKIRDVVLQSAVACYLDAQVWLSCNDGFKNYTFEAYSKGAERYQVRKRLELSDFCDLANNTFENCYFVTLTLNKAHREKNPLHTVKNLNSVVGDWCARLARKNHGAYLHVLETHLDGQPHWHALIYTEKPLETPDLKLTKDGFWKDGECLRKLWFDWFRGFISVKNISPRTAPADAPSPAAYLLKYITKGSRSEMEKASKTDSLAQSDRKALLAFFETILTRTRTFDHSSVKKLVQKFVEKHGVRENYEDLGIHKQNSALAHIMQVARESLDLARMREETARSAEEGAPQAQPLLERASTNFTARKNVQVRFSNYRQAKRLFKTRQIDLKNLTSTESFHLFQFSTPFPSRFCAIDAYKMEISGADHPWFHQNPRELFQKEYGAFWHARQKLQKTDFEKQTHYSVLQLAPEVVCWLFPDSDFASLWRAKVYQLRISHFQNLQTEKKAKIKQMEKMRKIENEEQLREIFE